MKKPTRVPIFGIVLVVVLVNVFSSWDVPIVPIIIGLVVVSMVTGLGRRAEGRPVTLGVNVRMTGIADIDLKTENRREGGERPAVLAVRLWRDADGTARMTCPHVARHSPTGPQWGYRGSGPADCARSVLLALVDEATAEAHYQAFKDDVIAVLPKHGAVIQRTAVLAWLAGQTTPALRSAA